MNKKIVSLLLIVTILLSIISGCGGKNPDSSEPDGQDKEQNVEPVPDGSDDGPSDTEPEQANYEFNPHLYLPILADEIPHDYWDSFYNLCDALRAGEDTFECSSEEAYKWATDPVTLTELFPAACTKVKGTGDDGSTPFENGIGRIYYQMPKDEYVKRQAEFEAIIVDVLNTYLDSDDNDFEKCLKLYDYMESNYEYDYDFIEEMPDGANYLTIINHKGECIELGSVYAYFLLQAGVEAMQVGGHAPNMDHAWTYLIIDGKGYHSDPTWALRSPEDGDDLALYYFLMTSDRRAESGFVMDDLEAPLLPGYFANRSSVEFTATDDEYCFPSASLFKSIDEENKTVYYICFDEDCELKYA